MDINLNIEKKHFIIISVFLGLIVLSLAADMITAAVVPVSGGVWHPLSGISGDGINSIDNGSGYIRADAIEGGSGNSIIQHAEDGDATNNARLYVYMNNPLPSAVKLTVLSEHSRSMGGDPVDFPIGVVLANTLSKTEADGAFERTEDWGFAQDFSKSTHTHTFKYIYNHRHKNGIYKEDGGKLPTNAKIYINGVERTFDIVWATRNPIAEKEKMIDSYNIEPYLQIGDNWIEIGSDQAFKSRFYLEIN
ncbi:MAG: hypothetical protein GQ477_01225 [Nanohaloarchaea archaeon]|nr:hypothetical protein [Candidatus Nanohaloarchaea archaeon]